MPIRESLVMQKLEHLLQSMYRLHVPNSFRYKIGSTLLFKSIYFETKSNPSLGSFLEKTAPLHPLLRKKQLLSDFQL